MQAKSRRLCRIVRNVGNCCRRYHIVFLVVVALMLPACRVTRYVPVETERVEVQDRVVDRWHTDTISDTRLIYINGDTVRDIRYRERIREVIIRDTCVVERTITEPTPYPVERELTWWERVKIDLGGYAFAFLAIFVAGILWRLR